MGARGVDQVALLYPDVDRRKVQLDLGFGERLEPRDMLNNDIAAIVRELRLRAEKAKPT
jgi:hypothetical protein